MSNKNKAMVMDDKWIEQLTEKLKDFEADVPDGLWESVQTKMSLAGSTPGMMKKHRKWRGFGLVAAGVALLVGLAVSIYVVVHDGTELRPVVADKVIGRSGIRKEDLNCSGKREAFAAAIGYTESSAVYTESSAEDEQAENKELSTDLHIDGRPLPDVSVSGGGRSDSNDELYITAEEGHEKMYCSSGASTSGELSFGISTSASGLGSAVSSSGAGGAAGMGAMMNSAADGISTRMGGLKLDDLNLPSSSSSAVFSHKMPLRFGIEVSLPLGRRISVATGVTYALLRSDISYGNLLYRSKATQSLHYVGIPVAARYTPFTWRNIDFYVAAGVSLEKCVAGKIDDDSALSPGFRYEGSTDRPFQFSAKAALGLQYGFSRTCAIYLEPGVGYHAADGSSLRNFYSDNPVSFNLDIGIRFQIPR